MSSIGYGLILDFARPVRAVIPGTQGRILDVLAETTAELNLRTIARLSGVSPAQVSRVLPSLVELGMVERREAPPSALFRFVADNVASRAVTALTRSRQTVVDELRRTAGEMQPAPVSVIVFGSLARGVADVESDLDIVMVRPGGLDEDDRGWRAAADGWWMGARRLTGNRIEVIEVAEQEIGALLRSRKPLWVDVTVEGIVVFGSEVASLSGRRSA